MIDNLALTFGMAALALLVPILGAKYVLPNLPGRSKMISTTTLKDAHSPVADTASLTLGTAGRSKTPLHPFGKTMLNGRLLEVTSRGEYIEAERDVEVCQIQGQKVVVRIREAVV